MKDIEELKSILIERGCEDSIVFERPDYISAVIGVSTDGSVIYDYDLMVEQLMTEDGMDQEDAIDFLEYNTIRAIDYMSEGIRPTIIIKL